MENDRCESCRGSGQRTSENDVWDKIERVENRLRDKLKAVERRLEKVEIIGTCRKCDTLSVLLDQSIYREREAMLKVEKLEIHGVPNQKCQKCDGLADQSVLKEKDAMAKLQNLRQEHSASLAAEKKKSQKALAEEIAKRTKLEQEHANAIAAETKKTQKAHAEIVRLKRELAKVDDVSPTGGAQFKASNGAVATVFARDKVKNAMLDFAVVSAYQALQTNDVAGKISIEMESQYGGAWEVVLVANPQSLSVSRKHYYLNFFLGKSLFLIQGSEA